MKGSLLSRRNVLLGAATCAATSTIPFDPMGAAAKAPMINAPAPYYYRFKLGNAEATIISDGTLPLGDPHASFKG